MSKPKTRTQQLVEVCNDIRYEKSRPNPTLLPCFERKAQELAQPEQVPVICGGEVLPANLCIRDTLQDPDTCAVDASLDRTTMLQKTGALEIGIDAAQSIDAHNSLEKMLAHLNGCLPRRCDEDIWRSGRVSASIRSKRADANDQKTKYGGTAGRHLSEGHGHADAHPNCWQAND